MSIRHFESTGTTIHLRIHLIKREILHTALNILLDHIRNKYSEEQGLNDSSTPEMGAYLPQSRKGRRKLRARDKRGKLARAQAAAASNAIV